MYSFPQDFVPGPGTYPSRSTVYLDHPCLKMPGRTKFASAPRFAEPDSNKTLETQNLKGGVFQSISFFYFP